MGTQALSAAGPGEAAARLFEEYGPQLYRFCLGRMRSREEAEDALQSTFLRAHKALAKGVVPEFEAAWLYKIAHNVCLSRRDVIGRYGRLETAQDLDEIEYALAAPEQHHDELVGLSDALAGMPANLRQALLLREWQGLSYAEIADAMSTTVSAVETLIFRARRELAASLEVDGKRKPRVAGLLDIGLLLGRLRAFLAGAAPAKLATGAVLVAVGGAGIGAAVAVEEAGSTPPRARVVAAAPVSASITPVTALAAAPAAARAPATPASTLGATPPPAGSAGSAPAPASGPAPSAAGGSAATPQPPSPPGGTTTTTSTLVPSAPSLTAPSVTTATVTAPALPGISAPTVPGVQAPPLAPPTVSIPTVDTTALPSVTAPSTTQLPVALTP